MGAEEAAGNQIVAATLTSGAHSPGVRPPGRRQEDDVNVVVAATAFDNYNMRETGEQTGAMAGVGAGNRMPHARVETAIAFHMTQDPISGAVSPSLGTTSLGMGARTTQGVRRLTPTECERLMGWPDGWTLDRGPSLLDAAQSWPDPASSPVDPAPDGRRYSACGDGVIAAVAEWIGLGFPVLPSEGAVAA